MRMKNRLYCILGDCSSTNNIEDDGVFNIFLLALIYCKARVFISVCIVIIVAE